MTLTLPDHFPALKKISDPEIREGLALGLYASSKLTLEEASSLAQLSQIDFESALRKRAIPRHYNKRDLENVIMSRHCMAEPLPAKHDGEVSGRYAQT